MRLVTEPRAVASGIKTQRSNVARLGSVLISVRTSSLDPARYRSRFCTALKGSQ